MIPEGRKFYGHFIEQPIFAKELFADLPLTTRRKLASIKKHENIKEGEIISKKGSFPANIFVFIEGAAQMVLLNGLNLNNNVRLLEKGEIVGLTQLISGFPGEMNVELLAPCLFDVFRAQDFLMFLKNEPQVCFHLFKQLSLEVESGYKIFSSMFF